MRAWLAVFVLFLAACTSVESLKKACDEGKPEGCEQACEKGELGESGCVGAAKAYATGQGVTKNEKRAEAFLKTACDGKLGSACLQLAAMKDGDESIALADKACQYGEKPACEALLGKRIELVTSTNKYGEVPNVLAALKGLCGPQMACPKFTEWVESCEGAMFFHNGLSGMDCPDYEPDCAAKKKAAVRPYCTGEKPIPKEYQN